MVAYLNAFQGDFQFSDYNVIVSNPAVHSWSGWLDTLKALGIRPLLKFSYTLNWVSGLGLFGYHLFNIAVHWANALLVYLLSRKLIASWGAASFEGRPKAPAMLAALLFAVHPVQTEAVTYICGRSSSLMTMFYLCSVLAYVRGVETGKDPWRLIVSPLCFIAAVATKEVALTLPVALVLWEATTRKRTWREIFSAQALHLLVLAVLVIAILSNTRYLQLLMFSSGLRNAHDNLLTEINGIVYLASRFIFVHRLNIDPDLPVVVRMGYGTLVELGCLSAFVALALWRLKQRPWLTFGILWFFLVLLPSNSIVARLDVVNERHLYLASFGVFLMVAMEISRLRQRLTRGSRIIVPATAVLVATLAVFTAVRNNDYRSEVALWESTVQNSPEKARGYNNLGCAYELANTPEKARIAYMRALSLDPGQEYARGNLDRLLARNAEAPTHR